MTYGIYWRSHRVGSAKANDAAYITMGPWGARFRVEVDTVTIPERLTIQQIAALDIEFDRDFAELRGITGVTLEADYGPVARADKDDLSG